MPRVRIINSARWPSVNVSGGPLNPYRYRMQRMDIHFPRGALFGSEHSIDSKKFPMEVITSFFSFSSKPCIAQLLQNFRSQNNFGFQAVQLLSFRALLLFDSDICSKRI